MFKAPLYEQIYRVATLLGALLFAVWGVQHLESGDRGRGLVLVLASVLAIFGLVFSLLRYGKRKRD